MENNETNGGHSAVLSTAELDVFDIPACLTKQEPEQLDYVARFPGMPGYGAWCADDPKHKKHTAKCVAGWIKRGASVERVTISVAKAGMLEFLDAQKRHDY